LATVRAVKGRTRGFIMVVGALVALGANVVDAANDGASVWNIIAILGFAVVLFVGFELVAKNPE
jgi:hypothetical protein